MGYCATQSANTLILEGIGPLKAVVKGTLRKARMAYGSDCAVNETLNLEFYSSCPSNCFTVPCHSTRYEIGLVKWTSNQFTPSL